MPYIILSILGSTLHNTFDALHNTFYLSRVHMTSGRPTQHLRVFRLSRQKLQSLPQLHNTLLPIASTGAPAPRSARSLRIYKSPSPRNPRGIFLLQPTMPCRTDPRARNGPAKMWRNGFGWDHRRHHQQCHGPALAPEKYTRW